MSPSLRMIFFGKPDIVLTLDPAPYSIVSTPDHNLHRRRRNALNSFFSVASIRRLEPIMKKYLAKLVARIEKAGSSGEVIQMHHLFKACASDVITVYAFDECFNFMDTEDFGKSFFESTDVFFYLTHIFGLVPWLVQYVQNMPTWLVKTMFPRLSELRDRQDVRECPLFTHHLELPC